MSVLTTNYHTKAAKYQTMNSLDFTKGWGQLQQLATDIAKELGLHDYSC